MPLLPRLRRAPPAPPAPPVSPPPPPPARFDRSLAPAAPPTVGAATDRLFDRLSEADVQAIEASLDERDRQLWEESDSLRRRRLALSFGLAYRSGPVAELTGLSAATPPEDVHLMGRGSADEVGGSYYYADLVLETLAAAGGSLAAGDKVLDFSCSSGRVLRVLSAALPDVSWHGCDPNAAAISWAQANISGASFFVSPLDPPLPFDSSSLSGVYAISVWSHYSAAAALRWLEEMRRALRPGGQLILTTHGLNSCRWFSRSRDPAIDARLGPNWIAYTAERLGRDGHCFWNVFGPEGDDGVISSDWGLSFFTPEWLLEHVTPAWSLTTYRIGRAGGNQDVYALTRR